MVTLESCEVLKDFLTFICSLYLIIFCTSPWGGDARSFQSLMPLKVLIKAWEMEVGRTAGGLPASPFCVTALSLEGGEGRCFSSHFGLTPKEARLSLVGGGVNELSRIFFSPQS